MPQKEYQMYEAPWYMQKLLLVLGVIVVFGILLVVSPILIWILWKLTLAIGALPNPWYWFVISFLWGLGLLMWVAS